MMDQKQEKANELFFVVDENDNPLDPLPRKLVHGHGVWHRVAHVWVLDGRGEVLCQQRSFSKESNPGSWEPFFGGHLGPNEGYEEGAKREVFEEIGLRPTLLNFLMVYKRYDSTNDGYNNEFQGIYTFEWSGDLSMLHFNDGEVEQVMWMPLAKVLSNLVIGSEAWTNCGYEEGVITLLQELTR